MKSFGNQSLTFQPPWMAHRYTADMMAQLDDIRIAVRSTEERTKTSTGLSPVEFR